MDDPIFEPWGDASESPGPSTPSAKRWRAPEEPPSLPRPEMRAGPLANPPADVAPRARLAGTPGFVRTMAMPRLFDIAARLQLARHEAIAEDLLDQAPPVARLRFRPWRGPWTERLDPPRSVLELTVETEAEEQIALRVWLDRDAGEPTWQGRISSAKLSAAWLETQVLDFVERALERV